MRSNVLGLDNQKAKEYFLNSKIYCTVALPDYFTFENTLNSISQSLGENYLSKSDLNKAKEFEKVNHFFYDNKDGRYAWRKLQIINPYIYVSLVNLLTSHSNWIAITKKI